MSRHAISDTVPEISTSQISPSTVTKFRNLVNSDGRERNIDNFLRKHLELWSAFLYPKHTGHHGGLVLPQQTIRPAVRGQAGLIPDFLVSGKNSDGIEWWVVELKSANINIFAGDGRNLRFSRATNLGIIQTFRYLDFCSQNQSLLQNAFKLHGFREPHAILVVGRQAELQNSNERMQMKAVWNRTNNKVEIRTYDWFLRSLEHKLYIHHY